MWGGKKSLFQRQLNTYWSSCTSLLLDFKTKWTEYEMSSWNPLCYSNIQSTFLPWWVSENIYSYVAYWFVKKKKKRVGSHPFVSHQESPGILNCNYLLAGPGLGWGEWGAWGTEFKRTFILRAVPSVVCASINLYPRHFTHFNLILVLPNSQKSIKLIIWIWIESKLRTWFIYGPLKCSEILH